VERLAADLCVEFPSIQGFSSQNLWYMRQFYLSYHDHEKLQPPVGEISWGKHLVILAKCKDRLEREFYLTATDERRGCGMTVPPRPKGCGLAGHMPVKGYSIFRRWLDKPSRRNIIHS